MDSPAERYIRALRNPLKKQYAKRYWAFINQDVMPTIGPDRGLLSYMAAQAVRMSLNTFKEDAVRTADKPNLLVYACGHSFATTEPNRYHDEACADCHKRNWGAQ